MTPLSHKQCRGRGVRMCGEMEDCARIEHSSLYNVFTSQLTHSAIESLMLLLLTLGMRHDAAGSDPLLPHCLFCEVLGKPSPVLIALQR